LNLEVESEISQRDTNSDTIMPKKFYNIGHWGFLSCCINLECQVELEIYRKRRKIRVRRTSATAAAASLPVLPPAAFALISKDFFAYLCVDDFEAGAINLASTLSTCKLSWSVEAKAFPLKSYTNLHV